MVRILRYLSVGAIGAIVNLGTFSLFLYGAHLWYVTSSVIAFSLALVVGFILQKFWTFRDRDTKMLPMQAVLYLLISLINLAVSLGLLAFFVEVLHLYPVVSQTLAVGLIAIESYFLYKKFVFIAS